MMTKLYRHKKTGTLYRILYQGKMQSSKHRDLDNKDTVVYQKVEDSFAPLWFRTHEEFFDGRFEVVT